MVRSIARVLGLALAIVALAPGGARATGSWSWPLEGSVSLPYGAAYTNAAGTACTHGGLDIAAAAGSGVHACAAGSVSFAGRVPAGEGEQAYAVSVLTADGLKVTYSPLRTAAVHKGDRVGEGDLLGSLNGSGDASSAGAHLHLGVKRGDTALDPASFLVPVAGTAPEAPTAAGAPAASRAPATAPSAPSAATRSAGSSARAASSQPAYGTERQPVTAPASAPAVARSGSTAAQALRDAIRTASDAMSSAPELTRIREVAETPVLDAGRMMSDLATGHGVVAGGLLRLALALVGAACVVPVVRGARRAAESRLAPAPVHAREAAR